MCVIWLTFNITQIILAYSQVKRAILIEYYKQLNSII